jgi:HNH endonuclease
MDRYIYTLYEIVTRGLNTNSYKFALWRALAALASARSEISKADLCPFFLGYYWPLEVKYHLRQSTDPDRDPIIMKRIRRLMKAGTISQGETLQNFKQRMPEEHKALLDRIEREAFDDVIPRFHIVRGTPVVPPIFTFVGKPGKAGDTIELTNGGRQFLIENKRLIEYVAVSGWVRFTEQFTSAPKLHDKIENNKKRGAVSQYREPLKIIQHGRCFYDGSHDMSLSEVDHVLPWSFVLEDKTWNLVLACRKCNNVKRDRLTNVDALERLCSRNEEIAKGYGGVESAFLRHFSEWHSRDLSSHIRGLYDQAVADGFPEWSQGRSASP